MTLKKLKKIFGEYIVIKDEWAIDMIFASLISNQLLDDDPVWLQIVGPSSGGKTTLLAPIVDIPKIHFIDDLTPNTFLSGFSIKGKMVSLLHIIQSGILAFSDFTNILSKNRESLGEILSQLKLICDGNFSKWTGTGKIPPWKGKMGFIGASTPDIYHYLESGRSMGERFIYYWLNVPTDYEIAQKQSEIYVSAKELTEKMKSVYLEYFNDIKEYIEENGIPKLSITPEQRTKIQEAVMFCVNGKATVHTNFKTGEPDQIPNKASIGRDNRMFDAVLHACQIMDAYDNGNPNLPVQNDRINMIRKCAFSAVNRERRKVLEILAGNNSPMTASKIGATDSFGLNKKAVDMYLSPLNAVGLIQKQVRSNNFKWFIKREEIRNFIKDVAPLLNDQLAENLDDLENREDNEDNDNGWDNF